MDAGRPRPIACCAAAPCLPQASCCQAAPAALLLPVPPQVVLHEGQILEKPEDEAQVGCLCCALLCRHRHRLLPLLWPPPQSALLLAQMPSQVCAARLPLAPHPLQVSACPCHRPGST